MLFHLFLADFTKRNEFLHEAVILGHLLQRVTAAPINATVSGPKKKTVRVVKVKGGNGAAHHLAPSALTAGAVGLFQAISYIVDAALQLV